MSGSSDKDAAEMRSRAKVGDEAELMLASMAVAAATALVAMILM